MILGFVFGGVFFGFMVRIILVEFVFLDELFVVVIRLWWVLLKDSVYDC